MTDDTAKRELVVALSVKLHALRQQALDTELELDILLSPVADLAKKPEPEKKQ